MDFHQKQIAQTHGWEQTKIHTFVSHGTYTYNTNKAHEFTYEQKIANSRLLYITLDKEGALSGALTE
jgi:hypothetical protein